MNEGRLRALFLRERDAFAACYPHVRRAVLVFEDQHIYPHKRAARDLAWAVSPDDADSDGELAVHLIRRVAKLPVVNQIAILRHELAHLCEPDLSEDDTDALAETIGGDPIRYDGHDIQTIGPGGPRPRHLHQWSEDERPRRTA